MVDKLFQLLGVEGFDQEADGSQPYPPRHDIYRGIAADNDIFEVRIALPGLLQNSKAVFTRHTHVQDNDPQITALLEYLERFFTVGGGNDLITLIG